MSENLYTGGEVTDLAPATGGIAVVGCGFVGSIFVTEFLKRQFAGKIPRDFIFIDDDIVESRNAANQNFLPSDAGRPKAEVMYDIAIRSGQGATFQKVRLTMENIDALLGDAELIIDGVDNLATRQLLWGYGMRTGKPVLHIGINEDGIGLVEWSHPTHDTFSLGPQHTAGKTIVDPTSGVTPPCELARMRGVGLNVGFAAAMAAAIFYGFDPEVHLAGEKPQGYLTDWIATSGGFKPNTEVWGRLHGQ